jgi:hypothetical protein
MQYQFKFNPDTIWEYIEDEVYYYSKLRDELFYIDLEYYYIINSEGSIEKTRRKNIVYDRDTGELITVASSKNINRFFTLTNEYYHLI